MASRDNPYYRDRFSRSGNVEATVSYDSFNYETEVVQLPMKRGNRQTSMEEKLTQLAASINGHVFYYYRHSEPRVLIGSLEVEDIQQRFQITGVFQPEISVSVRDMDNNTGAAFRIPSFSADYVFNAEGLWTRFAMPGAPTVRILALDPEEIALFDDDEEEEEDWGYILDNEDTEMSEVSDE